MLECRHFLCSVLVGSFVAVVWAAADVKETHDDSIHLNDGDIERLALKLGQR